MDSGRTLHGIGRSNGTVKYHKNLVTKRWEELGKQSVVLVPTAISK